MSKHPFGPWSETFDLRKRTVCTLNDNGVIQSFSNLPDGNQSIRSGVNQYKPYQKPLDASLFLRKAYNVGYGSIVVQNNNSTLHTLTNFQLDPLPSMTGIESSPFLVDLQPIKDRVKSRLLQKSRSIFNSGVFLGELKESVNMITNRTTKLASEHNELTKVLSSRSKVRALGKVNLRKLANEVSDWWLEYHFGIKPFLSDIDSAAQAIASVTEKYRDERVFAKETFTASLGDTAEKRPLNTLYVDFFQQYDQCTEKTVYKTGATYRKQANNLVPEVLKTFGITTQDIVPTIYELFPYSWLLDYVSNAQDLVTAISTQDFDLLNAWEVTITDRNLRSIGIHTRLSSPTGYTLVSSTPGVREFSYFQFTRSALDYSNFMPSFRWELPNLRQASNTFALVVSKLTNPNKIPSVESRYNSHAHGIHRILTRNGF
jgi:hypothetical protein